MALLFLNPSGGSFGGPYQDFPPRGGMMSDFSSGMRGGMDSLPIRGGYSNMREFTSPSRYGNGGLDRGMMETDDMHRFADDGPMRMGRDGFGTGHHNEGMGRPFLNDMPMNSGGERMMAPGPKRPENNSLPATLLKYLVHFYFGYTVPGEVLRWLYYEAVRVIKCYAFLFCCQDSFRIENEDDAQIVLKVTQKLTDVLMEYRLRSISSVKLLMMAYNKYCDY